MIASGSALPVWGEAASNADVTVTLRGITGSTQADGDGRWRVDLPAFGPGGPTS